MDAMDRKELERAASKVTYLRGLLAVPLGALFLLFGLGNLGWAPLRSPWVFLACLAGLALAWAAINRYYNDHYGRVTPGHRPLVRYVVPWTVFPAALIVGPLLQTWLQPPVSLVAALFAVAMLTWYTLCVQLQAHHVLIWGGLLIVALVPVWGSFADDISVALLPIGAATIICGVMDHWALVRSFGSPRGLDTADTRVGR
jgi:hypothetical protein